MSEKIVRFSRLLRIFQLNNKPAFIIELEQNNQKLLYISYLDKFGRSCFEPYNSTELKEDFTNLSDHCLMDQCTDASYMFHNVPITHFEADCSSLVFADSMFSFSSLCFLDSQFPLLEDGRWMFYVAEIKEIIINFPKLKNGNYMFSYSNIEYIQSEFLQLKEADSMFENTRLKDIQCKFPKLLSNENIFKNTPPELKQNYPHYFV